jgi:hypothetical protein
MSTTQLARRLAAAAAVTAAAVTVPLLSTAQAQTAGPEVPDNIAVEDGHKVFLVGHATGVQIYTCLATGAWSAATPRADLVGDNGKLIATHFGGPTWQTRDGSRVVAQRVDGAPATEPNAVPWLLLSAKSTSAGPDGDRLVATTFIQRTHTTGGAAPAASECDTASVGTTVEVPYTADYWFWKRTGG